MVPTMVPTMVPWYQSCPSSCAAIPSSSCSVCCHSETLSQQLIAEFTAMTWDLRQIPWTWTFHDMAMAIQNMLKHPKNVSRKMATLPLSLKNPGLLLTGLLLKVAIIFKTISQTNQNNQTNPNKKHTNKNIKKTIQQFKNTFNKANNIQKNKSNKSK